MQQTMQRQRNAARWPALPRQMGGDSRRLLTTPRTFTPAFPVAARRVEAADGTVLFANMTYKSGWTGTSEMSFYTFPVTGSEATFTNVTGGQAFRANGGGVFSADKSAYHLVEYVQNSTTGTLAAQYAELNTSDWSVTRTQLLDDSQLNLIAYDLTRDPQSGDVYGVFVNASLNGYELGVIDYSTLTRTTIGQLTRVYVALAADTDGTLYAIATDGNLYRLSKTDATATLVGPLGVTVPGYQQSATISQRNGTLYYSRFDNGASGLYAVDKTTGAASPLLSYTGNEQLIDLEVERNGHAAGSPAAPENMTVDFDKAARTATVSFTVPTKTVDGATIDGNVGYTIVASDGQIVSDKTAAGQVVTEQLAFETTGKVSVYAYLSNDQGDGPESETFSAWVGPDRPRAVTNVSLTVADGQASLSWTAPTEGVNGGYVDPDDITYTITRYPDSTVSTVHGQTAFSEPLRPAHTTFYYYIVTPEYDGVSGETATSNSVRVDGEAWQVPFTDTFSTADDFGLFDVIDLNGDGTTWEWGDMMQCATIRWGANGHNDVLLSPAIHLEPGNFYDISYDIKGLNAFYTEKYKVAWGDAGTDPSAYTDLIEDVTETSDYQYRHVTGTVSVDAPRDIRVAFWALSDANQGVLYLDNVQVALKSAFAAPAKPRFLTAQAAPQGALQATFTAVAPDKTAHGETLESLRSVVLYRDGVAVDSVTGVQPGGEVSLRDDAPANGYNAYSLRACNESGRSEAADTTLYVGIDVPQAPANIHATDNGDAIALTWEAPGETGARGGYADPAQLTYNIASSEGSDLVAENVEGLAWTDNSGLTGTQHMRFYGVQGKNAQGNGNWGVSNYVLVGDAYTLPFRESFPGQTPSHDIWIINDQQAFVESELSEDDDKGAMVMQSAEDSVITLQSGKIDISQARHPVLTFWVFKHPSASRLAVGVSRNGGAFDTIHAIGFDGITQDEGWEKVILPLTDYRDSRYIQLGFTVENDRQTLTAIDNITVEDRFAQNITLGSLQVPTEAVAGDSIQALIEVANNGYETARGIRLTVSLNGQEAATDTIGELAPGVTATKGIALKATAATASPALVEATAILDGDGDDSDNTASASFSVKVLALPTVDDLTGEVVDAQDGTVRLTWSRPDYHPAATVTDDMEAYTPWTIDNIGPWTTLNANDAWGTASLTDGTFEHMGEPFTAIVYRPGDTGSQQAHSGDQCLAVFDNDAWAGDYGSGCELTDKYLISPELTGDAQTIDFWYANAVQYAPESFAVMYSTTGTAKDDFQEVEGASVFETGYDTAWREMTADLPAGTRHFAIHVTSQYSYALLLDDITYAPASAPAKAPAQNELLGYNVYRDSVQQNTALITDTTITVQADRLTGSFQVSTVYTGGEAALSNVFDLTATGLAKPTATATNVRGLQGMIEVRGAGGQEVTITTVGGARVYSSREQATLRVAVPRGVYVVSVGGRSVKVTVR